MSEKTPKSNLRKLPTDAQVMNWDEAEAERFEEIATTTCGGRTNFNKKVTGNAQEEYGGAMQSATIITSESEVAIYVVLGGPLPEGKKKKGDRIALRYDKQTGTSFTLPLYKPLKKLGIVVPKGRICEIPVSVEEVDGKGVCIILDVKHKEFVAGRGEKKGKDEEQQQQQNSTAAPAKMEKSAVKK